MSDIPPIRDNDYESVRIPLNTRSGETAGLEFKICRKCGAIVFYREKHKSWHKKNSH